MKVLDIDVTARTKGRPPKGVPSFMRGWFIWDKSKRVRELMPIRADIDGFGVSVLGGSIHATVQDENLTVTASYAGMTVELVRYGIHPGDVAIDGGVAGFSVKGHASLREMTDAEWESYLAKTYDALA
jgi:hypothetical protein